MKIPYNGTSLNVDIGVRKIQRRMCLIEQLFALTGFILFLRVNSREFPYYPMFTGHMEVTFLRNNVHFRFCAIIIDRTLEKMLHYRGHNFHADQRNLLSKILIFLRFNTLLICYYCGLSMNLSPLIDGLTHQLEDNGIGNLR